MPPFAAIGLLLTDDGIVVIHEGWPEGVALPRIVTLDYIDCDYPRKCLLHTISGTPEVGMTGRELFPVPYRPGHSLPSPCEVLALLDTNPELEIRPTPLRLARLLRQRIQELEAQLNRREQVPTGDDYNRLHQLTDSGLIELLKALGDHPDRHD